MSLEVGSAIRTALRRRDTHSTTVWALPTFVRFQSQRCFFSDPHFATTFFTYNLPAETFFYPATWSNANFVCFSSTDMAESAWYCRLVGLRTGCGYLRQVSKIQ